jgi:catechol 2,3-dioxygenase-like lactoylglutathione lyase family enzyme
MPGKPAELNHVLVYCDDVEKSAAFYGGLLGMEVLTKMEGYARLVSPRTKTTLGLHGRMEHPGDRRRRRAEDVRLYFEVDDLDARCRRLKRGGVKFTQGPKDMPWGWRHAYLKDPDGHEVSLYKAGAKRLKE